VAERLEYWEQRLSLWRVDSALSQFNRTRTTDPQPVPSELVTLARLAQQLHGVTHGALDPTVGPLVAAWGYGPRSVGHAPLDDPSPERIAALRQTAGWDKIQITDHPPQLQKLDPQVELDFSAITEGWAVDQLCEMLRADGYGEVLVELGGELRALGRWSVAIDTPRRQVTLHDQALATSGTYRQFRQGTTGRITHLIDPRTGQPVRHATTATSVIASSCALADGWATALTVLGAAEGLSAFDAWRQPSDQAACVVVLPTSELITD
jgi:FAD:protein FMN transferase